MSDNQFKCTYCDKSYRHKTSLMNHVHQKHTDQVLPRKILKLTRAPKPVAPAVAALNVASASPAPKLTGSKSQSTSLKCPKCETKCSDNVVLTKHIKREHSPKTVWTISSNLNTKELDDLLEEEEDLAIHSDKIEHDIGINASAAEWHAVNFDSSFSNSGEFEGRNASTLTVQNKCSECATNSQTIENQ